MIAAHMMKIVVRDCSQQSYNSLVKPMMFSVKNLPAANLRWSSQLGITTHGSEQRLANAPYGA